MSAPELTEDDMEVAEASVMFALDNCPVEGVLSNKDGTPVSLDELESLLGTIRENEGQSASGGRLGDDALSRLKVVIDYTSENCPVEGVATFHDGRTISGNDIIVLARKLKEPRLK